MTEILNKAANAQLNVKGRGPTRFVIALFSAASEGVWVGGNVTLTDTELTFSANKMNRALHTGTLDIVIPLGDITGAKIIGGIVTKIISVQLVDGNTFTFRCSGARQVLDQLRDTVS